MTKSLNFKAASFAFVIIAVVFWILILLFKRVEFVTSWDAIKELPTVVGWMVPFGLAFERWAWRWPVFRGWLVLIPDLNGTWEGEFRSEWVDPKTNQKVSPQKAYLVIRQTLFTTSCCHITAESKSYSRAATIQPAPDDNLKILEYLYSNSPIVSVHYRSHAHEGACSLEIIDKPDRKLKGKYWTERSTKGEMEFRYLSQEMRQQY